MSEDIRSAQRALRLVVGDLTLLDLDAFVYYARHDLSLGAGYGNVINLRGGPSIQKELKDHGTVETCDVVVSGAGDLKARFIFHAVGPRFQEADLESKLRRTVRNVLSTADDRGVRRLGLPLMGAGFYGIPLDLSVRAMAGEIEAHLEGTTTLQEVVICANDERERAAAAARLEEGGA